MWRRILALVLKEFQALLRDRKSRFVLIGPPLIQLFVFSYAASYDITDIPYAVFDEDRGSAARELIARVEGSPHFRLQERIDSIERIEELIDAREVLLVLHIGPQFDRKLALGEPAPLQVIIDGRNSNTAMIVLNYVRAVVTRFNLEWLEAHGGRPPPARMSVRAWFNPNLESRWFIVPGIVGLLTLLVTLLVTALSVAREREHGTFDQLLVTPMRPVEILLGKALPGLVVGFVEGTFIILMAVLWFDIPFVGHPAVLYAGLAVFLLSATGVGIMISSISVKPSSRACSALSCSWCPPSSSRASPPPSPTCPRRCRPSPSPTRCATSWWCCAACSSRARRPAFSSMSSGPWPSSGSSP